MAPNRASSVAAVRPRPDVAPVTSATSARSGAFDDAPLYNLAVLGQDREGIVLQLSRTLSKHDVNVEELQSSDVEPPKS